MVINLTELHENFIRDVSLDKKVPIKFCKVIRIRIIRTWDQDSGYGLDLSWEVCAIRVLLFFVLFLCVSVLNLKFT